MAKAKTPSFILEMKLLTSKDDADILARRFVYAWRIQNELITHARKLLAKLSADKRYRRALAARKKIKSKKKIRSINGTLSAIRKEYGLSLYQFKTWVKPMQHRYRKNIDSRTAQAVADRVWKAVDKYLFDNGKAVHYVRLDDVTSMEGNDNATGIKYRKGRIVWNGLTIQVQRDKSNKYESEAMTHHVKYCRIVRKMVGTRWHYYVQLIMEGVPPMKHTAGPGRVGIDPGTLSVAVVSDTKCTLTALNEGVADYSKEINRIQRAMDRSRRVMNPDNYNTDGTVRRGRKHWRYSRNYKALASRKRSMERKQAASLRNHHERLANDILSQGAEIYTEDMDYKALQRRKKMTTINSRGRFDRKKRFGKSLKNGAPAMLLGIIDRKLRYTGHVLLKVNTGTFRASQYNHVTDDYVKKRLSKRHNTINGKWVQRDLYSAFLLMNSAKDLTHTNRSRCTRAYKKFLVNHDRCIEDLINSNCKLLSSFGTSR